MMVDDRRRSARHLFFASAEITEPLTEYFVSARTNELCRGGCHVDMLNPLFSGTALEVRIVHEGETFSVPARVVHSRPNLGMGLSFGPANTAQMQLLDRWLAGLAS